MFGDNPPERPNIAGARWNPAGVGAVYTAFERDTAIAEGQHAVDVQPLRPRVKRVLYQVEVSVTGLIDLTAPGALAAVGLTTEDISADDFRACQRVGGGVAWLERGGLIVPSARAPGDNLVILVASGGFYDDMTVFTTDVIHDPIR
jgi:RES domain-containing protein